MYTVVIHTFGIAAGRHGFMQSSIIKF